VSKCAFCGDEYRKTQHNRIYCSIKCQRLANATKKRNKRFQAWDRDKFPNQGIIQCLRCEENFSSWDKNKNHVCPVCEEKNSGRSNVTEHIGYKPNYGMFFYG